MTAIHAGLTLAYSPENWEILVGLRHFDDAPSLSAEQRKRVVALLDEWRERHRAFERGRA